MTDRKITIIGSGPAGATAAIFLGQQNIPVTVIEKDHFPRDKVCGDCLGGYALSVISQMGDGIFNRFIGNDDKIECGGVHLFGPQHQQISIPAINLVRNRIHEVALARRVNFDDFLYREAVKYPSIRFVNGIKISEIRRHASGFMLRDGKNFDHETDFLILATGSVRNLCRQLTGEKADDRHFATGIRTYYENVEGWNEQAYIELHFLKDLAPGYLWIFPLPGNVCNVGLGLRTSMLKRRGIDLKEYLKQIIGQDDYFRNRFRKARQIGEAKGFPLALGGHFNSLSGERYLLAGDAGHLIEPLFGEGIGHAMYSGKFAAQHVLNTLAADAFSAGFNKSYDRMVYDKLGSSLRFSRWMNHVARYPSFMRFLFNRAGNSEALKEHIFGVINGQTPKTPFHGIKLISSILMGR